eukprot:364432-Chlamydomonas_euryale.AAC.1
MEWGGKREEEVGAPGRKRWSGKKEGAWGWGGGKGNVGDCCRHARCACTAHAWLLTCVRTQAWLRARQPRPGGCKAAAWWVQSRSLVCAKPQISMTHSVSTAHTGGHSEW